MANLSRTQFLKTLPDAVRPLLPEPLQGFQVRQPWRWLVQLHYGESTLHYEVSSAHRRPGWEVGLHFESRDKKLNRWLLTGFRRHLFEIKDTLGESVEAEMWIRGWTKVYEVMADESLTTAYQTAVSQRLAAMITCLHPIFVDLRRDARQVYR